jgi:uncharacterized protein (TIGR03066 family)
MSLSALAFAVVLLVPAGLCSAVDDNATAIVGKWEITSAENKEMIGAVIEFTKDGKFITNAKVGGKELKLEGTYKVEKDKLTTKLKMGDQVYENTDTISKLTDDALETIDKDKKATILKRKK